MAFYIFNGIEVDQLGRRRIDHLPPGDSLTKAQLQVNRSTIFKVLYSCKNQFTLTFVL